MSSAGVCHVSNCFVSSDSDSILDQVRESGAIPHRRPVEFSRDKSTANEVVSEFVRTRLGTSFDIETTIVYLQPTSPFRNWLHVREAVELHFQSGQRNVVSVRSSSIQLDKLVRLTDSGLLTSFNSDVAATSNRQELSDSYLQPNGAIYVFKIVDFLTRNSFPITGSIPYRMDVVSSLDIDLDGDLELAQYLAGVADERI